MIDGRVGSLLEVSTPVDWGLGRGYTAKRDLGGKHGNDANRD